LKARGGDLQGLIEQLVQLGARTLPDRTLHKSIVGAVERELIEQVMRQCGGVKFKAADRLGINRNTLHKKVELYERLDDPPPPAPPEG
jgi:DNA-binding protein Fis